MAENNLFTDNGKELKLRKLPQGSLWEIIWAKGGKIPQCLSGHFTSKPLAIQAIKEYLAMTPSQKRLQYEETRAKEEAAIAKAKLQAMPKEAEVKEDSSVFIESGTSL